MKPTPMCSVGRRGSTRHIVAHGKSARLVRRGSRANIEGSRLLRGRHSPTEMIFKFSEYLFPGSTSPPIGSTLGDMVDRAATENGTAVQIRLNQTDSKLL